jgi:hypothetical protein
MKNQTVDYWATLFGIELIDTDGFVDVTVPLTVGQFYYGHLSSCINIVNSTRYSVLCGMFEA